MEHLKTKTIAAKKQRVKNLGGITHDGKDFVVSFDASTDGITYYYYSFLDKNEDEKSYGWIVLYDDEDIFYYVCGVLESQPSKGIPFDSFDSALTYYNLKHV